MVIALSVAIGIILILGVYTFILYTRYKSILNQSDLISSQEEALQYLQREFNNLKNIHKRYDEISNNIINDSSDRVVLRRFFWAYINGKPPKDIESILKQWKKSKIVNKPMVNPNGSLRTWPITQDVI
jgi:hypothetical protein